MTDQDQSARERAARAIHLALNSGMTAGVTAWNAVGTRDKYLAAVDAVAAVLGAAPVVVVPRSPWPWRQGRRVLNHVYSQAGDEPADTDRWVGSFPDTWDALIAVKAVNAVRAAAVAEPSPMHAEIERLRAQNELLSQLASVDDRYLTAACLHGRHAQCRTTCVYCGDVCRCDCHQED